MSRHQFRLLVVIDQFLVLGSVVVQEITDRSLPSELKSYLGIGYSVLDSQAEIIGSLGDAPYWSWVLATVLGLIAAVGLCLGLRWGRGLFVAAFVIGLLTTPLAEFYLTTGWTAFVSYLVGTTEGMIIALAYFSPVRRMFNRSEEISTSDAA